LIGNWHARDDDEYDGDDGESKNNTETATNDAHGD